jgi:hypothetical protein
MDAKPVTRRSRRPHFWWEAGTRSFGDLHHLLMTKTAAELSNSFERVLDVSRHGTAWRLVPTALPVTMLAVWRTEHAVEWLAILLGIQTWV